MQIRTRSEAYKGLGVGACKSKVGEESRLVAMHGAPPGGLLLLVHQRTFILVCERG